MSDPKEPSEGKSNSEDDSAEIVNQVRDKLSQSALGVAAQQESLGGKELLKAVGGIRGLCETSLPPLVFLVVYFLSGQDLWLSVIAPVCVSVLFFVIRLVSHTEITSALAGGIGVFLSAGLAVMSGNIENNFLLGIITNSVLFVVFLVSVFVKRPIVGFLASLLMDAKAWREDSRQRKLMVYATIVWVAVFGIRMMVQVPLYFLGDAAGLALAKLALGLPLYAVALWLTWLLIRAAFIEHNAKK